MNLKEVEAFVAVVDDGAVQAAAERLGVPQSVVTRRIQRLEAELGAELLDRGMRPSRMSKTGAAALGSCREILNSSSRLREICAPETSLAELSVGVAHGVEDLAFSAPLDRLRAICSWRKLRLSSDWSASLVSRTSEGKLDAAIVLLPSHLSPPSHLRARLIGREQVLIVAASDADLPENPTLSELAERHWVLNGEGCGHRGALGEALRRAGLPFEVRIETFAVEIQMSLVARGAGLGLIGPRLLSKSAYRDDLRIVHPKDLELSVGIWCIENADHQSPGDIMRAFGAGIAAGV